MAEAEPLARRTAPVTLAESGLVNSSLVTQANGDLTFTLDTGTAYDPQAVQRQLDDDGSQSHLSDTIRQVIDQDLGDINDDTTWVQFDGVVNTVGTTGLSLTVPAADVQTAETWKQSLIAMAAGYLTKLAITAACFLVLPEAALACPAIGRLTGALVSGLATQYFNHELKDPKAYAKTFLDALKATVKRPLYDSLVGWMKRTYPVHLGFIAGALDSWVQAAGGWIAQILRDMADLLPDGIAEWGPPPTTTDTPQLRVMVVGDSLTSSP
ncbi:hypothetical protein [Streptomyces sp. NPDC059378]|uniref:hypothetical protein n=1 Tax=Streptomyces sp. NPDC059378 TaxID=3346815 RepID=UPI003699A15B